MRSGAARTASHLRGGTPPDRAGAWTDPFQVTSIATPRFTEIHLCARPLTPEGDIRHQAVSAYARLLEALSGAGATPADVITEKIIVRDLPSHGAEVERVRREFYRSPSRLKHREPAASIIQQPPLGTGALCEIQAFALITAEGRPVSSWNIPGLPEGVTGRVVDHDGLVFLHLGGLTGGLQGDGLTAEEQAGRMFRAANSILLGEGFGFRDVYRTWIYLPFMDDDYDALNRARRAFFSLQRVSPAPASTGIGGRTDPGDRRIGMNLSAVAGLSPGATRSIHAESLNEAPSYGSDFARGTRVDLDDRALIHLSGTASIDTRGEIVHPGDIEGQVDRMLVNVEELLAGQGAGYGDLVSLTTYLKHPEYLEPFRRVAAGRGLDPSIPHTICHADVCRPGWLCETEGLAILA